MVDVSGLAYRVGHKTDLSDRDGVKTNIVFGVLKGLSLLAEEMEPEEIVVFWDRGVPDERMALCPEYKGDRKKKAKDDPEYREFKRDLQRQLHLTGQILENLPIVQVGYPGAEADDAIAVVAGFARPEKLGIITIDSDLFGLATENHQVFNYRGEPQEFTDLLPEDYLPFNAMKGGKNNVPGLDGVGKVGALRIIEEMRVRGATGLPAIIEELRANAIDGQTIGKMSTPDAIARLERNYKVMVPGGILPPRARPDILDQYRYGRLNTKLNERQFRQDMKRMGFTSIRTNMAAFLAPFRGLERSGGRIRYESNDKAYPPPPTGGEEAQAGSAQTRRINGARKLKRVTNPHRGRKVKRVRRQAGHHQAHVAGGARGRARAGCDSADGPAPGHRANLQRGHQDRPGALPNRDGRKLGARGVRGLRGEVQTHGEADPRKGRHGLGPARAAMLREVRTDGTGSRQRLRAKAVGLLAGLINEREWVYSQPSDVLEFVRGLIDTFGRDPLFIPKGSDIKRLKELRFAYQHEMPDWM
jgi:DNA polymerase-1